LISAHTPSVHQQSSDHFADVRFARNFREELALTVIRDAHPSLAASPEEVAVNFTIPEHSSHGGLLWIETT
jgi:hypothetical protein